MLHDQLALHRFWSHTRQVMFQSVTTLSECDNIVRGIRYVGLQGTKSSKKKKHAKLKRVMATVKKQAKKENANPHDSFAAVQLLNDPQV